MARFGVSLDKERELRQQMLQMGIRESDLKEQFIRASGPGGQNVNKVATCVYLVHLLTGVEIKCQSERTQGLNRYKARCLLLEKIAKIRYEKKLKEIQNFERKRRQSRKRSLAMKEAILEHKHQQTQKKDSRKKIHLHNVSSYE